MASSLAGRMLDRRRIFGEKKIGSVLESPLLLTTVRWNRIRTVFGSALLRIDLLVWGKEPSNESLQLSPQGPSGTVDAVLLIQEGAADAAGQLNSMLSRSKIAFCSLP